MVFPDRKGCDLTLWELGKAKAQIGWKEGISEEAIPASFIFWNLELDNWNPHPLVRLESSSPSSIDAVSYTHLTLPTILLV